MPVGYACNNIVPCQKGEKQGKNGKDIGVRRSRCSFIEVNPKICAWRGDERNLRGYFDYFGRRTKRRKQLVKKGKFYY